MIFARARPNVSILWFALTLTADGWSLAPGDYINYYGQPSLTISARESEVLHPFWAQMVIGSDLIPEALDGWKDLAEVPIGVGDSSFHPEFFTGEYTSRAVKPFLEEETEASSRIRAGGAHGTGTVNLINGTAPIGVAVKARIVALASTRRDQDLDAATKLFDRERPWLLNISMTPITEHAARYLEKLSERFIVITSAGNEYPERGLLEGKGKVIKVGSMAPMGLATLKSQEGNLLWAPADFWIKTKKGPAQFDLFSETSAAAALVTGALANVLSILPGMDFEELKFILLGTVLKTANSLQPLQVNGFGTLNALKLVEVAKRLRVRGWPDGRESLLQASDLFNFQREAGEELSQAKDKMRFVGERQRSAFRQLRRSFLLDETNDESRNLVISIFSANGLHADADFYRSLRADGLKSLIQEKLASVRRSLGQSHWSARAAARTAGMMPKAESSVLLEQALKTGDPGVTAEAVLAAHSLGEQAVPLLKNAMEEKDDLVRAAVCRTTLKLYEEGNSLGEMGHDGIAYLDVNIRTAFGDYKEFGNAARMVSRLRQGQYTREKYQE